MSHVCSHTLNDGVGLSTLLYRCRAGGHLEYFHQLDGRTLGVLINLLKSTCTGDMYAQGKTT